MNNTTIPYKYTINSETNTLLYFYSYDMDVVIDRAIEDELITRIGIECFTRYSVPNMKTLTLNGIKIIETQGISDNDLLTTVNAKDLEIIMPSGIMSNVRLSYVDMPNLKEIREKGMCKNNIYRPIFPSLRKLGKLALASNTSLKTFEAPNVTQVPYSAFTDCKLFENMTVGDAVFIKEDYCRNINVRFLEQVSKDYIRVLRKRGGQDFTFDEIGKETVTLVNYFGTNSLVIVPDVFKGKKVKKIESCCFAYNPFIQEVVADSVEIIGENCFTGSSVEKVQMNNLKVICEEGFSYTKKLKDCNFENLTFLGKSSFLNSNVEKIYAPNLEKICNYGLSKCKNLRELQTAELKKIGKYGMADNINLETLITENIKEISEGGLINSGIKGAVRFNNLQKAGPSFLKGSFDIQYLYFDILEKIPARGIRDMASLKKLIAKNVKQIDIDNLENCDSLTVIEMPNAKSNIKSVNDKLTEFSDNSKYDYITQEFLGGEGKADE